MRLICSSLLFCPHILGAMDTLSVIGVESDFSASQQKSGSCGENNRDIRYAWKPQNTAGLHKKIAGHINWVVIIRR